MEVVEVRIERGGVVDRSVIRAHVDSGREVHAVIQGERDGSVSDETSDGWEIGAVTALLDAGATVVRGVEERRVERVRAVIASTEEAR